MGFGLGKIVKGAAKAVTGGLGDVAKKAVGGFLNKTGLGGMVAKLFGGSQAAKGDGMALLNDIKSLLTMLVGQMKNNGGQAGQCGGHHGARGPDAHSHSRPAMGGGHAQECAVNIPGFGPSVSSGGNDVMHGGQGNDRMYGGRGNDVMYGD